MVARSFPNTALTSVKRSPVSCMPSPESPANRMTTSSRRAGSRGWVSGVAVTRPSPRCAGSCADGNCADDLTDGGRSAQDGALVFMLPSRDVERLEQREGSPQRGVEPPPVAGATDELG